MIKQKCICPDNGIDLQCPLRERHFQNHSKAAGKPLQPFNPLEDQGLGTPNWLDRILEDQKRDHEFYVELVKLINKHSMENASGTPDYVIGDYLMHCLQSFNRSVNFRENWYGRAQDPKFGTPTGESNGKS